MALASTRGVSDNQTMSDTVLLALITAASAIVTAAIAHHDRHQLAASAYADLERQTSALAKPNAA